MKSRPYALTEWDLHFAKNDKRQISGLSREFQGVAGSTDEPIRPSGGLMVRHGPEISEKRGVDRLLIVSVFCKVKFSLREGSARGPHS